METNGYNTYTATNNCDTSISSLNTTTSDPCIFKSNITTSS